MELPVGTVTMVFTDIEGSTRLLQKLGPEQYVRALEDHRRLLRQTFAAHDAVEVEMQGDSFHFAFAHAHGAVLAATEAQQALAEHAWESEPVLVRIGIHSGEPLVNDGLYAGVDVHRAARVMGAGHGGQVLVSAATRALLSGELELRDLGEHRLKDLLAPVRLYQLGEGKFPPLRSLYRTKLPVPPTPFLGRERELAELAALLAREEVRLVTLTGPGGTGKTRLAVQAAAEAAELYPDGIYWVGLAALRDQALVVPTVAQTLEAQGELAEHIGSKRLLVVLDNLEQVIEAAPELAALLAACPRLTLLATSREPLHVSAEREYPVSPLQEADAVNLFHERARAAGTAAGNSEIGEISEICRRLDQLPLAIELAAARLKVLSPTALLERLEQRLPLLSGGTRDAPERQRTLTATIDWSYDLLIDVEQQLFARLSVFAGGCTLEAAEQVCGAELDTLHSLVDKSLLSHSNDRYWMLETIREYAVSQLAELGETQAIRQKHAGMILELAGEGEEDDYASGTSIGLLEQELDNLRAALAFLEDTGQAGAQLELIARAERLWVNRGLWTEGRRWAETALAATEGERSARRGKALLSLGWLALSQMDLDRSVEAGREARVTFRALNDEKWIGRSLLVLGLASSERGEYDDAERLLEESMSLAREAKDRPGIGIALGNLGDVAIRRGMYEGAIALTLEAVAIFRELGWEDHLGWALYNVALCLVSTDQQEEAAQVATESLVVSRRAGNVTHLCWELVLAASLMASRGNQEVAARILGATDVLRERIGLMLSGAEAALNDETVAKTRQALGRRYEVAFAEGRAISLEEAVALALEMLEQPSVAQTKI